MKPVGPFWNQQDPADLGTQVLDINKLEPVLPVQGKGLGMYYLSEVLTSMTVPTCVFLPVVSQSFLQTVTVETATVFPSP